jgi:DNA-directed RNA polymerase subunit RPC12/RpoP
MNNATTFARPVKSRIFAEWFINSASVMLLVFAVTLFWCNLDDWNLIPPQESHLGVSLRSLFFIAGGIFLAVSFLCLGVSSYSFRVLLLAWLAVNFEVYQAFHLYNGSQTMQALFAYVSAPYGLSPQTIGMLAQAAFLYLLAGSLCLLVWFWLDEKDAVQLARQVASGAVLKTFCPDCGGHILFSATNLGQQVPCPHCQRTITLRKPENLKMACFFCQEHIEFPSHSIGEKIRCPHCKMDITLKEPA